MSKKLTIILMSVFFAVVFISIGFFAARNIYQSLQEHLIDQYAQDELVLAKQTATVVEDEVSSTVSKLQLIAMLPDVKQGNQAECTAELDSIAHLNSRISNIGRVNVEKKFQCSLNKTLVGTDASRLGPYINEIFTDSEHKPVMSRVIKVPNGGYAIAIHVPVYDEKNKFIGTVGGAIYFEDFSNEFLKNVTVANQGYVVLQDDDGTILYHPRADLIGTNRRPKNPQEEATASAITKLIIKSSQDGSSGTSRYVSNLDQKEKVGAFVPAEVFPGRRWIVTVTVPIEDIQAWTLITQARKAFGGMFLLLIGAIVIPPMFLIIYLNFSVFKPIARIGKAAAEIGNGNLDVQIPVKHKDEIGSLAQVFNDMATRLKATYQSLETRVQEKTRALSGKLEELEKSKTATLNILEDLEQSKELLSSAKQKDEAIIESIGDGLIVTDEKGVITIINLQAQKMLSLDDSTAVGKELTKVVVMDDENDVEMPEEKRPMHIALSTGNRVSGTFYYKRATGESFPIALTITPVKLDEKIIGTIEVFRDITHEKEVDRAKSEFVSLASHQLRTPLSAINWYTEMLLNGDVGQLTEDQKKYLDEVAHANERMVDLVNSLLNASRLELGTFAIDPKEVNVIEIAKSVVGELRPQIEQKHQTLHEIYPENIPHIMADEKLTRMIIQNFMTNAVKYTPENGTVTLEIYKNDIDQRLGIKVVDTGYGIPNDQQSKIFSKLYRADNVKAMDTEGTGLGLYIIKEIIDEVGGKVWFESEENKGSTFFAEIPLSGMKKKEGTKKLD